MNRAGFLARIGGAVVAGLVGRKAVAEEPQEPHTGLVIDPDGTAHADEWVSDPWPIENCVTVYWRDGMVCVSDEDSVVSYGRCRSWYDHREDPQIHSEAVAYALAGEILRDRAWPPRWKTVPSVDPAEHADRIARQVLRQIEREAARAPRPNPFTVL